MILVPGRIIVFATGTWRVEKLAVERVGLWVPRGHADDLGRQYWGGRRFADGKSNAQPATARTLSSDGCAEWCSSGFL